MGLFGFAGENDVFIISHIDVAKIKRLPALELQEIVTVDLDPKHYNDREIYGIIYRIDGEVSGQGQVDVIDGRHNRCLENSFILKPRIIRKTFYPLEVVEGLDGMGIGTIAYVKTLLKVIEEDGHLTPTTKVKDDGLSEEGGEFQKAMGVKSGMTLQQQLETTIAYAVTKGFYFENPFTNDGRS